MESQQFLAENSASVYVKKVEAVKIQSTKINNIDDIATLKLALTVDYLIIVTFTV